MPPGILGNTKSWFNAVCLSRHRLAPRMPPRLLDASKAFGQSSWKDGIAFFFFFFFFVFLPFLGPLLRHMEVPRLGVESEL